MTRCLHLHVGLPKCGSTALQGFLAANRQALRQEGFDYPDLTGGAVGNLTPFVMSRRPEAERIVFRHGHSGFDPEAAQAALVRALEHPEAPNTILSAEGLSHPDHRFFPGGLLGGFDRIRIHIFFRPRPAWFVSHYCQAVRVGRYREDIGTVLDSPHFRDGIARMLRFAGHLEFWHRELGAENVYPHFVSGGFSSPVQQFLSAIGSGLQETGPLFRNASLSAFETCALAHVERRDQKDFLTRSEGLRALAAGFDPDPGAGLLTPEICSRIAALFAEDTEALLGLQTRIARSDLEPDMSALTARATSFAEIRKTQAFSAFLDAL